MADENIEQSVIHSVENVVNDANVIEWQKGLAAAVNDTYSYANSSLFYAMMPAYYRDYAWRYIRPACQWLDGYVWSLHQSGFSGIMSTRIASRLITGLTKQIVGEKLIFKVNERNIDQHDVLHFVSDWSEKQNIMKAVYAGIGFAMAIGTSLVKANVTSDQEIWWEACRFDNCFYTASFMNEIKEATFMIRNYVDTKQNDGNKQQFFLVEHRFYKIYDKPELFKKLDGTIEVLHKKGEKVPMVEYQVHRVLGTVYNNMMPTIKESTGVKWDELPKDIRSMIKHDYSAIRVGEPLPLPFKDLGVVALLNGEIDLSVPTGTNFGESMLVGIQDDLITYELASSYLIRDMYLGKGTVYVPKSMSMQDFMPGFTANGGVLNGIGEDKIEIVKGISPENQQMIVQQFDVRQDSWQVIKENSMKNMAVKWGMSPKILANFLTQGAAMTATQIDSEDDSCIAFIYHTRSYFKNGINKLLKTTLEFYGYEPTVTIDFASPSLINKDRLLNRVTGQMDAGLMDVEDAIRTLNPDLDEEALQKKIDKAIAQQQQMMLAGMTEMNDDGTFGNPESDDQLNGSTEPIN